MNTKQNDKKEETNEREKRIQNKMSRMKKLLK